ncbi:hypothetical protein FRZ44_07320 [Hypericibacter terrae]|uniref:Cytochrome b6 n=1 Tax=Hypericibacter terrae TaxID=2602015 RepID=A0A5J6MDB0_9PROT|nr:DUF2189 domain-containing protein [Hypericibacter terrae]QEX15448.1 hypothetical protein FRZ44_07320 [Hypericibacter terrae]
MTEAIRNPVEWSVDQMKNLGHALGEAGHAIGHTKTTLHSPAPALHRIRASELKDVIRKGFADYGAYRTDVIALCVFYPVVGLLLARAVYGHAMLPLLFPLASGFALIGPFAALGLYEMSREREHGERASWVNAFAVLKAPAIGPILLLGLGLVLLFLVWLAVAWLLYAVTLGPAVPLSIGAFARDLFTTGAGWTLIVVGCGIGFLFALLAMSISVISFPLLLDKDVGLDTAVRTSIRAVRMNPGPMAAWGLIVVGGLVLGSIPLFLGLIVVMPVLGHATWHLYRKLVAG